MGNSFLSCLEQGDFWQHLNQDNFLMLTKEIRRSATEKVLDETEMVLIDWYSKDELSRTPRGEFFCNKISFKLLLIKFIIVSVFFPTKERLLDETMQER
jgi:hypothetical protein